MQVIYNAMMHYVSKRTFNIITGEIRSLTHVMTDDDTPEFRTAKLHVFLD